jgi:hypothetical protein
MGAGDRVMAAAVIIAGVIAFALALEAITWMNDPGAPTTEEIIFSEDGQPVLIQLEDGTLYTKP